MRRLAAWVLLAAAATLWTSSAWSAELLMFRRDGCAWCQAWDREIGPIYSKTEVGRRAPLRMVDITRDRPQIALKSPVIYTPTFVLVKNGREIARIEGYAGDHFFWGQLEALLEQLPPESAAMLSAAPQGQ